MADTFKFQLITPTGVVFDGVAEQVTAKGPLGEFGVLAAHTDFITSLVPGLLEAKQSGGAMKNWVVSGGLAEVRSGEMTVLAGAADAPETIDANSAAREEQAADEALSQKSFYDPDYAAASEALQLARARNQAASGKPAAH
ncbi:MAG TPA: ATP synthase F1 subunit epsilon [Candidatus Binataceae bacterium]|nr:ATP synthase F1 subunit epsilon [Candidatus Binataceae bacterium]